MDSCSEVDVKSCNDYGNITAAFPTELSNLALSKDEPSKLIRLHKTDRADGSSLIYQSEDKVPLLVI
ncbi:hypothetical protein EON65_47330 [archaeon]|nr:MAG: hypothetical protein EON65_47330 [archaeon]